jgi:hypothetical protein
MTLRLRKRRQRIHAFNHFNHALFALTLFATRGGHIDAQGLGAIKKRSTIGRLD